MKTTNDFTDVRNITHQSRCDIGFLIDFREWEDEPAVFTSDELIIQGHPVMERWEENYMRDLAYVAASNGGAVLEVGFGLGMSAEFIQTHPVDKHVIIEANADVFKNLQKFAEESTHPIIPLQGFWQDVTKSLPDGSFSGILFDTYPLTEEEIHKNHFTFFKEAYRLLADKGVLTYYSDEIDAFSDQHIAKLTEAGFTQIDKRICKVTPPQHCQYWKSKTILTPIITK